jgi:hypothetical protein
MPEIRHATARRSEQLRAVLGPPRQLYYTGDTGDLPAQVRAASAIRRRGARLVIVQDDVNALAILDPQSGSTRPVRLPGGADGGRIFDAEHGNKKQKMDLEACVVLPDGRLIAFGSGSSSARERIVVLDANEGAAVALVQAADLYGELSRHAQVRNAQLNIEGAVVQNGCLRLLQRGNGRHGSTPWNAILDRPLAQFLAWLDHGAALPPIEQILEVDLGAIDGVPLGFTDATVAADGRLAFLACAEDTADALSDGPVLGCLFGWLDRSGEDVLTTEVLSADGGPALLKLEGIEASVDGSPTFDVVADMDCPDQPAQIATLTVRE